jgi:fatty-acyl-CoA synthase
MATGLTAHELRHLSADCDAKLVVVDAALQSQAQLAEWRPEGAAALAWGGDVPGCEPLDALVADAPDGPIVDEAPGALMMYTSGTTGASKGVWRALLPPEWRGTPPFAADLIALWGVGGEDVRYLSTAPLYHAAPLRGALAVTAGGGTVFVMDRFDAETALALLQREHITHSQWVPSMFQRLLALPDERRRAFSAPAHRTAIHGAAPCPPELKRRMIDWWGPILLEYYSGSEGVGLTLIDAADWLQHPGSVGRARKGEIHIVDADGRELPVGVTGLVTFAGGPSFEYYKAPQKTAERRTPQGWQTFGDVGHVDAEGYLYLTDRLDDVIISGGVNVYPQEIESAIREVPGVWDCAVVGVGDESFGERPVAFVVPRRGREPEVLIDAVRQHCRERLGRHKQPARIIAIDALPRSPTGKLLRRQLREVAGT